MDLKQLQKELGLRIKAIRNSKNYTQEQFCEIINLEQPNLSNIETGKNLPDIMTLFSIIENGKAEPNFLLGFLNKEKNINTTIDYEIIDLLLKLPQEAKINIKNIINLIK